MLAARTGPDSGCRVSVGQAAPEFALPNVHGGQVSLPGLRGRAVLVVFVPFAFTPVCSGELAGLVQAAPAWRRRGVDVALISCDAMPTLRQWADEHAAGFEVLSDFWPHGQASRTYGAFSEVDGAADRVSVLIDATGVVRWTTRAVRGRPRPVSDYESAIDALTQEAPSSDAVVEGAEDVLAGPDGPGR